MYGLDGFHKYLLKYNYKLYYCISIVDDKHDFDHRNDFSDNRLNLEFMQFKIKQLDVEISQYQSNRSVVMGLMRSFKMCPDLVILGCSQRGESEVGEGFDIIFC